MTRKRLSTGIITDFQFMLLPRKLLPEFEMWVTASKETLTILLHQILTLGWTSGLLLPRLPSRQVNDEVNNG